MIFNILITEAILCVFYSLYFLLWNSATSNFQLLTKHRLVIIFISTSFKLYNSRMQYNLCILYSTIIPDIFAGCNMPLNHLRSTFEFSCSNKRKQCSYIKYTEYKLFIPHLFRASGKAPDKARINFLLFRTILSRWV